MKLKTLFLSILLLLTFASPAFATTYYACNSSVAINSSNEFNTAAACNSTFCTIGTHTAGCDSSTFPDSGSTLEANAKTSININVDPGPNGLVTLTNANGGGFTYTTTTSPPATVHANCTAVGAVSCCVISGASGSTGTFTGTCTGSATGAGIGCNDSHAVAAGTMTYNAGLGGAGTAGAYGVEYTTSTTGTPVIVNTCTGSSTSNEGVGCYASGAIMSVGSCVATASNGCSVAGVYATIVTGNLIYSTTNVPITGKFLWQPNSNANYIQIPTSATPTYIYAGPGLSSNSSGLAITGANTAAQVQTTAWFVRPDTGTLTQGAASSGGGGSSVGY